MNPAQLTAGDRFPSPRLNEGTVTVVCDYGKCTHETDADGNPSRPNSVHVIGRYDFGSSEFFIALCDGDWMDDLHVCDGPDCDHPADINRSHR